MIQDLYVDGLENVHVTGPIVRFDLVALQPGVQTNDGKQVYQISQRVVMPLESFIKAFQLQEQVLVKLEAAGVITKQNANLPETAE